MIMGRGIPIPSGTKPDGESGGDSPLKASPRSLLKSPIYIYVCMYLLQTLVDITRLITLICSLSLQYLLFYFALCNVSSALCSYSPTLMPSLHYPFCSLSHTLQPSRDLASSSSLHGFIKQHVGGFGFSTSSYEPSSKKLLLVS